MKFYILLSSEKYNDFEDLYINKWIVDVYVNLCVYEDMKRDKT